jgi:hypothetical protein
MEPILFVISLVVCKLHPIVWPIPGYHTFFPPHFTYIYQEIPSEIYLHMYKKKHSIDDCPSPELYVCFVTR